MTNLKKYIAIAVVAALAGTYFYVSSDTPDAMIADKPAVIRGLKSVVVKDQENSISRKYPSVLQPASVSTLSFEIAGNLTAVSLDVGQYVAKGDVLATMDPTTLELQVETSESALRQARSAAQTAADDYQRKATLLEKGSVTKTTADQSKDAAEAAKERLVQAEKQLETAQNNRKKAVLRAPFDGIINTVEVNSFANVSSGSVIATMYGAKSFEASFSVSYDVINLLTVGKKASIRLADNPAIKLSAHVSELGARADTVSSFPVVITIEDNDANLKAGMAIEISLEFAVDAGEGFLLPLSVLVLEGDIAPEDSADIGKAAVYVYDAETSTVHRRFVEIAGVRDNSLIVASGLQQGDRVASAGVSFLREGQAVKLLPDADGE